MRSDRGNANEMLEERSNRLGKQKESLLVVQIENFERSKKKKKKIGNEKSKWNTLGLIKGMSWLWIIDKQT